MGTGVCFSILVLSLSYSEGEPTGALHTGPLQKYTPLCPHEFFLLIARFHFLVRSGSKPESSLTPLCPHPNMNQLPSPVKSAAEICLNASPALPQSGSGPSGSLQDNGSGVLKDPLPSQLLMPIPPSNLLG